MSVRSEGQLPVGFWWCLLELESSSLRSSRKAPAECWKVLCGVKPWWGVCPFHLPTAIEDETAFQNACYKIILSKAVLGTALGGAGWALVLSSALRQWEHSLEGIIVRPGWLLPLQTMEYDGVCHSHKQDTAKTQGTVCWAWCIQESFLKPLVTAVRV